MTEQIIHSSDCAVHNAPALPEARCNCGAVQHPKPKLVYETPADPESPSRYPQEK